MTRVFRSPPVLLTFLVPADRCNQRCPSCYITEVVREPVNGFDLAPADYVRFIEQLLDADVPLLAINFQGYEVTLPRSWPYVEAVFRFAQRHQIRRSFITNGMLLHKYSDRIEVLDPIRISVSLDGSAPDVNDRLRGLSGAFSATVRSLRSFLESAPRFRDRLAVCSCLYGDTNFESLLRMPRLLNDWGVTRWALAFELVHREGRVRPASEPAQLRDRLSQLRAAAHACGVACFVNDEFDHFGEEGDPTELGARKMFDPEFLYRFDPTGHVRVGSEMLGVWDASLARQWDPERGDAVQVTGYREAVQRYWRRRKRGSDSEVRVRH